MNRLTIAALTLCVAACETAPSLPLSGEPEVQAPVLEDVGPVTSLPAQRLEPGACGMFLFEMRPPSPFILFEDEAAQSVHIVHDGELYRFAAGTQAEGFLPGEAITRSYASVDADLSFTLSGVVGEDTPSGTRLQDMILTAHAPDGTRTVRPVAGVRRCGDG